MFAKLNIKGITDTAKKTVQSVATNIVKKKATTGCKSCGKR